MEVKELIGLLNSHLVTVAGLRHPAAVSVEVLIETRDGECDIASVELADGRITIYPSSRLDG